MTDDEISLATGLALDEIEKNQQINLFIPIFYAKFVA